MERRVIERVEYHLSPDEVKDAVRQYVNEHEAKCGTHGVAQPSSEVRVNGSGAASLVACESIVDPEDEHSKWRV